MIEIPEALTLAGQMEAAFAGRNIVSAVAGASPHSFAWYMGDPACYGSLLGGRSFGRMAAFAGYVEAELSGDMRLVLCEGASPRRLAPGEKRPGKHQLLIEFDDGSALCVSVQMYGGIYAFRSGELQNPYYLTSREALSPLDEAFDAETFENLRRRTPALSMKAFLATEQRIPGLGNGVLQDILFRAKLHPKRKLSTLSDGEYARLFSSVKSTLADMAARGGRDVERDLFGNAGGYTTVCSKRTVGAPCPVCSTPIVKEAYLGGAVYYCPVCQK